MITKTTTFKPPKDEVNLFVFNHSHCNPKHWENGLYNTDEDTVEHTKEDSPIKRNIKYQTDMSKMIKIPTVFK